jgi:hypothetical protein
MPFSFITFTASGLTNAAQMIHPRFGHLAANAVIYTDE